MSTKPASSVAPVQSMVMPFRCPTCGDDLDKEHDLYSCHRCKQAWPHSYVENGMLSDSDLWGGL